MKTELIENGRFKQAIWLRFQDDDFLTEYTCSKCVSINTALKLWDSLTTELLKAGCRQYMRTSNGGARLEAV